MAERGSEGGLERVPFQPEPEMGPVVHPEPIRIPLSALTAPGADPAPSAGRDEAGRRLRMDAPTLFTAAFAAAWMAAGWARHDLAAYAIGFAFTLAVIVSAWGRAARVF